MWSWILAFIGAMIIVACINAAKTENEKHIVAIYETRQTMRYGVVTQVLFIIHYDDGRKEEKWVDTAGAKIREYREWIMNNQNK